MWKHKNFINLQLCSPPPITTTRNIYVNGITTGINIGSESSSTGTWTGEQEFNTSSYTISGNTVVWNDGTILQYNSVDVLPTDTIVENRQYTTRASASQPTLTFKHFFDAGTIGSGTVKFRHYSQQEPSSATLINFTINGTAYQAEEGMTWEQWCDSSYNANSHYNYWYYDINAAFIFCREEGQQKTVAKSNNELVDGVLAIEPNTDYIHMVYPNITIVNNGTITLAVWNSTNKGEPAGGNDAGDRHILSPGEQITISSYPKDVPRLPLLYVTLEAWGGAIPMLTNSDIDVTAGIELIEVVNNEQAYFKVRISGTITARPYDDN